MTLGKDYGIKVDVPWYIKCPIVNWFFNTCKVKLSVITFSTTGSPVTGVDGEFRIPFQDKGKYINSIVKIRYCIPKHEFVVHGNGLYFQLHLVDVNHRKVYDQHLKTRKLEGGYWAKHFPKCQIWFDIWKEDYMDVTFHKKDYGRK